MSTCPAVGIDSLAIFNRLKKAGMPDEHAQIQTEVFREQAAFCVAEIRQAIEKYDEVRRQDLATRGDVQDVRLEVEKVRAALKTDIEDVRLEVEKVRAELKTDIEGVRLEVEKVRAELKTDIEKVKSDLLKWMLGLGVAVVTIMVTGFGTLGVIIAKALNWTGF